MYNIKYVFIIITVSQLVVVYLFRPNTHNQEVVGSNPHCGDHFSFFIHHSFGSKPFKMMLKTKCLAGY